MTRPVVETTAEIDAGTVARELHALASLAATVAREHAAEIARLGQLTAEAVAAGNKLLFCGNGGSAADAQHLATEYVVRFRQAREPIAAVALTTDSSLLTASANDYGFEHVFARQVRALGRAGDLLFLHSTSGRSPNLLRAAEAARDVGMTSVALLARGGGELAPLVDCALIVPTDDSAHAQEIHLAIGHLICQIVEARVHAAHRPDR
jgi:D-sedoheptulose 7-phosphate isomerase